MALLKLPVKTFKYGTINSLEDASIPRGAASASLNWLSKGDRIELRRGMAVLGTSSVNTGNGFITGLKKITDALGVEHLWKTYGKKLKYFDRTTEEWVETGTNLLGTAVIDANSLGIEDISIEEYVGLAGYQFFVNSPNCAGIFKIMTANPDDYADQYAAAKNFKGWIKIDTNRTFLWGRNEDDTSLYGSYIDTQTYTTVTGEATTSLTGTLAFKAGGARRTCFAVQITITASGEVYSDNFNGTLTGTLGGTGTINYTTGDYTLSNAGVGTANYQWEDTNTNGIMDFTKSATRTAGQGFVFLQAEGGGVLKNIAVYKNTYYCFHLKKTWELTLTNTDTNASNLPYRDKVGIASFEGRTATGNGIYFVDYFDKNDPKIRILTYDTGGAQQVIPVAISNNLNLNGYLFDKAAVFEFGDFILIACATSNSTRTVNSQTVALNNRTIVYNKVWNTWDILDYSVTKFDTYDGALVAGSSLENNVLELFSGYDDDDSDIPNYWNGKKDDLDYDGLKKVKKLRIAGLIQREQKLKVSISLDEGPFVEVGNSLDDDGNHIYAIEGTGDYVDLSGAINIGSQTLGRGEIGGGSGGDVAYNFEREFSLRLDKFETIKVRFEATEKGYVSVSEYAFIDIRTKGQKVANKYRG